MQALIRLEGKLMAIEIERCQQWNDKNGKEQLITQKGINWNDFPICQKRGSCCVKIINSDERSQWIVDKHIPIFKDADREYINKLIYVGEK